MTAVAVPWAIQALSHPASAVRQARQGVMGGPFGAFAGGIQVLNMGSHGVCGAGDLAVTQNGTPNMSVNVAGGLVSIRGTENQNQGVYGPCYNDGTVNLAISASDPTNPRRDLVVAKVRDAQYSGASNDFSLAVVTGTPAASPVDPAIPANCVVLARVSVAAAAASIVNANITDLRVFAAALGGTIQCLSTNRPTGINTGQMIAEMDTGRILTWDGSSWIRLSYFKVAGRTAWEGRRAAAVQSIPNNSGTNILWDTEDFDSDGFITPTSANVVIPTGLTGFYSLNSFLQWGASGAYTAGLVFVIGSTQMPYLEANTYGASSGAIALRMAAGVTLNVQAFQTSGAAMNMTGSLNVTRLGP